MGVLRSACESSAVIGLSSGSIIPTLKNGFTVMHEQAGSGSGAQVMNMLLPSGPALESYFEQQGLGRAQEGKRLKMLTSLILEVGRKSGLVVLLSFFFTQSLPPSLPPSLPSLHPSLPPSLSLSPSITSLTLPDLTLT